MNIISLLPFLQSQDVSLLDALAAYFIGRRELLSILTTASNRTAITLQIVFLAGLSDAIGNSAILFANRVRPLRFVPAVIATALLFVVSYFIYTLTLMLIATRVFGLETDWGFFSTVVGLSYIPLLFSFFTFLPFFGYPINLLLYAFSTIYLVRILEIATDLSTVTAAFSAIVGFVLLTVIRSTVGRPFIHAGQWFITTAAGRRLEHDIEAALGIKDEEPGVIG